MANELTLQTVEKKIVTLRNEKVILDSNVAELYGVETKRLSSNLTTFTVKYFPGGRYGIDDSCEGKKQEKNEIR